MQPSRDRRDLQIALTEFALLHLNPLNSFSHRAHFMNSGVETHNIVLRCAPRSFPPFPITDNRERARTAASSSALRISHSAIRISPVPSAFPTGEAGWLRVISYWFG